MSRHFQRDLDELKNELLHLGGLVEVAINDALLSLTDRRPELADSVLEKAAEIDKLEVKIEEECLKIMALHQPVAVDLRFLVVVLKVNNDLERMGDIAENIAHRSLFLNAHEALPLPAAFTEQLPGYIKKMTRSALDSLIKVDVVLAGEVIDMDDKVDNIHRQMYAELQSLMKRSPDFVERAVQNLSCSRNLERIADLSTNIAEDVIFMVEGEVVRHRESVL